MHQLAAIPITEAIPEDLLELWEERAAIMEHEGGLSLADAAWCAFLCVCAGVEALAQDHAQQLRTRAMETQMLRLLQRGIRHDP
jgi:hypothetical protein